MTTGVPLYLVSACGSAEEFVSAFRRYADRTGVFIPAAEPLPQGKRGRIALTLKDGGVMVEGEAEIVQSSQKSPLHGRAGMVVKFTEPDEPSRTVLAELEKARLAMKPVPPSVPPRPAVVPAQPRPVPPAIGGRIDAANALAECVVIGDPGGLRDVEVAGLPPKAGPKFVVPAIPAVGARPKTPTGVPETKATTLGMPAIRLPGELPPTKDPTPVPAAAPRKDPTPAPAAAPRKDPTPAPAAAPKRPATPVPAAVARQDSSPIPATAPAKDSARIPATAPAKDSARIPATAPKADSGAARAPAAEQSKSKSSKLTQLGFPVVKAPAEPPAKPEPPKATTLGMVPLRVTQTQPVGIVRPPDAAAVITNTPPREDPAPKKPPLPAPTPTRAKSGTTPPRHPTPAVPLPVARVPAKAAPVLDADEKTDLTEVPEVPVPQTDAGFPGIEAELTERPAPPPEPQRPQRSGGMRASEILAAVQVDDWTMTPDASGPTVLPAQPRPSETPEVQEPTPAPKGPPTGNWTISLDPETGWSEPAKVETPPPPADAPPKPARPAAEKRVPASPQTPSTGNPVMAVASEKPIEAVQWEDKPTSVGDKIEIDPTLMEPLTPLPGLADGYGSGSVPAYPAAGSAPNLSPAESAAELPPPPSVPNASGSQPVYAPPDMPMAYVPAAPPAGFGYPAAPPAFQAFPGDGVAVPRRSSKRVLVIAASAAAVVILAIVLALTLGGKHGTQVAAGNGSAGSAAAVVAPPPPPVVDAAVAHTDTDQGSGEGSAAAQVVTPPAPATCSVEVTSSPTGAEVIAGKKVLGRTPGTFTLPCGKPAKLIIKKPRHQTAVRSVTPTPDGAKLAVALGVGTFAVKVTSSPAGATILVGGRSKGVTPASVQLPAFSTQTITLKKDGYLIDSERVVIKSNGISHHVTLKKGRRR